MLYGSGATPAYKEDLTGLPGWVAFYRQVDFPIVPLVMAGIGVGAFLLSRSRFSMVHMGAMLTISDFGLKPVRAARKNRVATIAVIAIVLSVFNLGALAWQIAAPSWLDRNQPTYSAPVQSSPSNDRFGGNDWLERMDRDRERQELERQIDCVNQKVDSLKDGYRSFGLVC